MADRDGMKSFRQSLFSFHNEMSGLQHRHRRDPGQNSLLLRAQRLQEVLPSWFSFSPSAPSDTTSFGKGRSTRFAPLRTFVVLSFLLLLRTTEAFSSTSEYGVLSSIITLISFATRVAPASALISQPQPQPAADASADEFYYGNQNWQNLTKFVEVEADHLELSSRLLSRYRGLEADNLSRIVGGNDAPLGMYPHQVQILYGDHFVCGGSLVAANLVISAAHCTAYAQNVAVGRYVNPNKVATGSGSNSYPEEVISICNAGSANHEFYGYPGYGNSFDIALYKLCRPVTIFGKKHFITLNAAKTQFERLTVTGWGALSAGGNAASILQQVDVDFIPNSVCGGDQTVYSPQSIHADMICAGMLGQGGRDACQGDSGGPLMLTDRTFSPQTLGYNPHLLVGVVSWGAGCAQPNAPGVYARISYFKNWLTNKALTIAPTYGAQLKWSYDGQVSAPTSQGSGNGVITLTGFSAKEENTGGPSQLPSVVRSLSPSSPPNEDSGAPSSMSAEPSFSPVLSPSAHPSASPSEKPVNSPSTTPSEIQKSSSSNSPSASVEPSLQPSATRKMDRSIVVTITKGQTLTTPGDAPTGTPPISYVTTFELLQHTFPNGCVDRIDPFFGQNGYMRYCSWIAQVSSTITSPLERAAKVNSRCEQYGTICPVTCGFCSPSQ